jgi:hypothetical protein
VKLPVWVLVTVKSAPVMIVVASLAVLLAALLSPPPETPAILVTVAGASDATFSVIVIGG